MLLFCKKNTKPLGQMCKRFTYTNTYTQNKHTHGLNERKSYNTKIMEKNRVQ